MKNFQIEATDGKKYWIARSLAVAGFIFKSNEDRKELYVLANKRGPGTPDFQGYWSCPCGYLDFDETLAEACSREIKEECGLEINPTRLKLHYIEDSPSANRQNVTHRFTTFLDKRENTEIKIGIEGEQDEVADVKWIPLSDVDNYLWAFGHDKVIKDVAETHNKHLFYV